MHSLDVIHRLNDLAAAQSHRLPETETTRRCSYTGSETHGYVLHSAKHRSTCFLSKGTRSHTFWLLKLACNSDRQVDKLIESYFS